MAKYLKPQTPLQHYNGDYIYPITSADQVLVSNGERLNANLININLNNSDNIPENVLKPQNPMIKGSDYFYPLTTSDQVIFPNRMKLEDNLNELPPFSKSNKIVNGIHAQIAISNTKKGVF